MEAYSFSEVDLFLNGVEITGLGEGGDVMTAERRNDAMTDKIGAKGNMVINISADKSGTVTLKLQQTSPTISILQGHVQAAQAGAFAPLTFMMRDSSRNDIVTGTLGYCPKMGPMVRGDEVNDEEWVLVFEDLFLQTGDVSVSAIGAAIGSVIGGLL